MSVAKVCIDGYAYALTKGGGLNRSSGDLVQMKKNITIVTDKFEVSEAFITCKVNDKGELIFDPK